MPSALIIGDSHANSYFGSFLKGMFEKAGWDVTKVSRIGITAAGYLAGRESRYKGSGTFADVAGKRFDLAIVELGTNDAAGISKPSMARGVADSIAKLAGSIGADSVWWVAAPAFSDNAARTYNPDFANGYDLNQRAEALWQALSPTFGSKAIDPRSVTAPYVKQKDVHFGTDGGKAWAEFVYNTVTAQAAPEVAVTPIVIEQNYGWLVFGAAAVVGVLVWRKLRRQR